MHITNMNTTNDTNRTGCEDQCCAEWSRRSNHIWNFWSGLPYTARRPLGADDITFSAAIGHWAAGLLSQAFFCAALRILARACSLGVFLRGASFPRCPSKCAERLSFAELLAQAVEGCLLCCLGLKGKHRINHLVHWAAAHSLTLISARVSQGPSELHAARVFLRCA